MIEKEFLNEEFLNREAILYNKVEEVNEINKTMEEIKKSDFGIKELKFYDKKIKYSELLKNAALCDISIKKLNLPYGEIPRIEKLKDIMQKKYKALNPELNDEVIDTMGYSHYYYKPYYYYDGKECKKITIDILVIENAVFVKQGIVDNLGNVYNIDIRNISNSYYDVFGDSHRPFDKIPSHFSIINKSEEYITHMIHMYHDLSFLINSICGKAITCPRFLSELKSMDDSDHQLSYKNLFGLNSNKIGQKIYIDAKFEDIEKSWKNLEERDYKLCVLNKKYYDDNEEDITMYTIHQSFENKYAEWTALRENCDVWRLTDAASKIKNLEDKKILCKRNYRIKKKP